MNDFSADVKLAAKGDTAAFARLYEAVADDMYHIALYSLRNTHDACDAVSDAVMDAFCSIGKLRDENAFRKWIFRILSAKIKRKQKEYMNYNESVDEMENIPLTDDFSYESVELKEALGKLDSESKLMLSMSVLGGYSSEEIADVCKLKSASVRSKLSRIRRQLRMSLSADGDM